MRHERWQLGLRHMQQRGTGPDSIQRLFGNKLIEAAVQHRQTGERAGMQYQGPTGIQRRNLKALLQKITAIPPRTTTGIQNMAPCRQMGQKLVVQTLHLDIEGTDNKRIGMLVVIGDGHGHRDKMSEVTGTLAKLSPKAEHNILRGIRAEAFEPSTDRALEICRASIPVYQRTNWLTRDCALPPSEGDHIRISRRIKPARN